VNREELRRTFYGVPKDADKADRIAVAKANRATDAFFKAAKAADPERYRAVAERTPFMARDMKTESRHRGAGLDDGWDSEEFTDKDADRNRSQDDGYAKDALPERDSASYRAWQRGGHDPARLIQRAPCMRQAATMIEQARRQLRRTNPVVGRCGGQDAPGARLPETAYAVLQAEQLKRRQTSLEDTYPERDMKYYREDASQEAQSDLKRDYAEKLGLVALVMIACTLPEAEAYWHAELEGVAHAAEILGRTIDVVAVQRSKAAAKLVAARVPGGLRTDYEPAWLEARGLHRSV
jgi:hypothetical protein